MHFSKSSSAVPFDQAFPTSTSRHTRSPRHVKRSSTPAVTSLASSCPPVPRRSPMPTFFVSSAHNPCTLSYSRTISRLFFSFVLADIKHDHAARGVAPSAVTVIKGQLVLHLRVHPLQWFWTELCDLRNSLALNRLACHNRARFSGGHRFLRQY